MPRRRAKLPSGLTLALEVSIRDRNARLLAHLMHQQFLDQIRAIEITPDILAWASTATPKNSTLPEFTVAQAILHRTQEEARGSHRPANSLGD